MDPFINPQAEMRRQRDEYDKKRKDTRRRVPLSPTRDVLLFLLRNAPLEDWQQDILGLVRDESYYFAPQAMTKVMNEGWATYWHSKLMTEHFLDASEIIDYAEQHSGVVHMPPGGFNPYKIGVELYKDIERRWDRGQHGHAYDRLEALGSREAFDDQSKQGRKKIFEVRAIYNDVNFIDEFLTPEFVDRHRMYQYRRDPQSGQLKVVSRDFDRIKQTLLYQITNMGQPFVYVADGNYMNRGELYLMHRHDGHDLQQEHAKDVLKNIQMIWNRPVHIETSVEKRRKVLSFNGRKHSERTL